MITGIDWQRFHFLRPKALWLFVPLAAVVLLLFAGDKERRKWRRIVAPALQPYLFTRNSKTAIILPVLALVLGIGSAIIGIAGPAWKMKDIPGEKINAVVLIALDLSKSMLATDLQPSRLERGKFKINDFLDANPGAAAGLVAFAGTAHPVLPFTSDYKIMKQQAISLSNKIMPVQGTNMPALITLMDTMMQPVTAPSTVFLLTDALDNEAATLLSNWINTTRHRLEILLLSSTAGAAVPGYKHVLSRQDMAVVQNLQQDPKITITQLTLDHSDVTGIAARIKQKLVFEKQHNKSEKEWDDMGWLLLIPCMAIAALWFRKGWTVQWVCIPFILLVCTSCGVKSRHPDWWYSKDYQGQLLYQAGNYAAAAEHFEDDNHKAAAYYKAGDYDAAADLFSLDTSAAGQYNKGLALAKAGRYADAEDAFKHAILLDASLKGRAQQSLEKMSTAQHRADSVNRFDPLSVSKTAKTLAENKKNDKKDPLKERKPSPQDEQLSADTRVKQLPKHGDRMSDEVQSNIHRGKEAQAPQPDEKSNQGASLAGNILLKRAVADPAEFLHRRFLLQQKRSGKHPVKQKEPW
ncbi:VWA domain-containing protein [Deminuibacter soli]|nr:VWA domain-containing protein [Deminuibacter soli]